MLLLYVSIAIVFLSEYVHCATYLPGVAPHEFEPGEQVLIRIYYFAQMS